MLIKNDNFQLFKNDARTKTMFILNVHLYSVVFSAVPPVEKLDAFTGKVK